MRMLSWSTWLLDVLWGQPINWSKLFLLQNFMNIDGTTLFSSFLSPLFLTRNLNLWSKIFIFNFWSSQCLRLLRPCIKWRGQKKITIIPSIFMKFWSRNNLVQLDWLTLKDIYYLSFIQSIVSFEIESKEMEINKLQFS